jgi:hypothetical protein
MISRTFVLSLTIAVVSCNVVMADTGLPWVGWITMENTEEASVFVLPDGSGPSLSQAMLFGGLPVDASIVVGLVDIAGFAIANFPWEDIWLDPETETVSACLAFALGGFWANSNTDINGETSFSTSLAGGGWTEGPIWVYLNGSRAMHQDGWEQPPVPLRFNSADINADGGVNLADVSLFAADYFGEYHYRCDFRWDGSLNLLDIVMLATGLGTSCD